MPADGLPLYCDGHRGRNSPVSTLPLVIHLMPPEKIVTRIHHVNPAHETNDPRTLPEPAQALPGADGWMHTITCQSISSNPCNVAFPVLAASADQTLLQYLYSIDVVRVGSSFVYELAVVRDTSQRILPISGATTGCHEINQLVRTGAGHGSTSPPALYMRDEPSCCNDAMPRVAAVMHHVPRAITVIWFQFHICGRYRLASYPADHLLLHVNSMK